MPGDNVELDCELVFDLAVEVGSRFTLREANKTSQLAFYSTAPPLLTAIRSSSRDWCCHKDPRVILKLCYVARSVWGDNLTDVILFYIYLHNFA